MSTEKTKTFLYRTRITWQGEHDGVVTSAGKPDIVSAPPLEFRGPGGRWSPEDLLVASANACAMMTFLALARQKNLAVVRYQSEAEGTLEQVDGQWTMTGIVIRPDIMVQALADVEAARAIAARAEKQCIIAHSLKAHVVINAMVRGADT